ncbi:MAG: response regulator transcription factor [Bacteroidales bacterium]|nr:response regulator transcription factor [Bacteroidales bacterium]
MIRVALIDEHPVVCDAIKALLAGADDIEVTFTATSIEEMIHKNAEEHVHVTLFVNYNPDVKDAEDVKLLLYRFPKIKVLILSMYNDETFILKMIKAGAKGHLARDSNRSEMLEAIYTLRNGFEYYAKTITNILLSSYLSDKDIDNTEKEHRQKDLSDREMEVLKLFAEGTSNRAIAEKLFISVRTVETHKNNIMKKINLKTTVDLVKFAIKNNIIEI